MPQHSLFACLALAGTAWVLGSAWRSDEGTELLRTEGEGWGGFPDWGRLPLKIDYLFQISLINIMSQSTRH